MREDRICLYCRPPACIIEQIVALAGLLTGEWFTANVPEDTRRDLLFQDVFCAELGRHVIGCLMFTSLDGSLHITLMATHPAFHGQGIGSRLMERFIRHARQLGFERIVVLTVPPEITPSYHATVHFYQKHGFVLNRHYTELWEHGALELVKVLKSETGMISRRN